MLYDNCKSCYSNCEHAGKDREFVCPGGVSCKTSAPKEAVKIRVHKGHYQTEDIDADAAFLIDDPITPKYSHAEVIKRLMDDLKFHPSPKLWCEECYHKDCTTCPGSVGFDYNSVAEGDDIGGGVDRADASFYYDGYEDVEIPASIIARIRRG